MPGKKLKRGQPLTLDLNETTTRVEDLNDSFLANFDKLADIVERQQKTIFNLEQQVQEQKSKSNLQFQTRILHLNNDCLHLRNLSRMSSVIFSGVNSNPRTDNKTVKEEVKKIMGTLNTSNYELARYVHIPWGDKYAIKCVFTHASTCGNILRNSYNLIKAGTSYRVRPDLSFDQRSVRAKLIEFGKQLKTEKGATCVMRSWRYLEVTYKDGSVGYYEADLFTVPMAIESTLVPTQFKKNLNKSAACLNSTATPITKGQNVQCSFVSEAERQLLSSSIPPISLSPISCSSTVYSYDSYDVAMYDDENPLPPDKIVTTNEHGNG